MDGIASVTAWIVANGTLIQSLAALLGIGTLVFTPVGRWLVDQLVRRHRGGGSRADLAAFSVAGSSEACEPARPPSPDSADASFAVLPFESLSADREDAYLADGIASELIVLLSRLPNLRVAGRAASFIYRGTTTDMRKVGRELSVRYILSGSMRRSGERLRVLAELNDAELGAQLWSGAYERHLKDVFAVQAEIAEAILGAVGGVYWRERIRKASLRPTRSLDAWSLFHKAGSFAYSYDSRPLDTSLALLRRAIKLDRKFGSAHALLGTVQVIRVLNGFSTQPEADLAEACRAAERAGRLSPEDPITLHNVGFVLQQCGQRERALIALRRALECAPYDFLAWGFLGYSLGMTEDENELAEANAILDRLLQITPDHPLVPTWLLLKAAVLSQGRDYAGAAICARRGLERLPAFAFGWGVLANALGQLGRSAEARAALASAQRINPTVTADHWAAQAIRACGGAAVARPHVEGLRAAHLLTQPAA